MCGKIKYIKRKLKCLYVLSQALKSLTANSLRLCQRIVELCNSRIVTCDMSCVCIPLGPLVSAVISTSEQYSQLHSVCYGE